MRLGVIMIVAVSACASSDRTDGGASAQGSVQPAAAPSAVVIPRWPADQEAHQLGSLDSVRPATVPLCRPEEPLFTADGVGPLRAGQSLREAAAVCQQMHATWDWGDEGIPSPALLVRFGAAVLQLSLEDTLPASRILTISSRSPAAHTSAGIHPGSTFAEFLRTYGTTELGDAECVLYASAAAAPRLSFRLDLGGSLDCVQLATLPASGAAAGLPSHTRVEALIAHSGHLFTHPRSDSAHAAQLEQYGVLVAYSHRGPDLAGADTGGFYFLSAREQQPTLRELGFIRAGDLLDPAARLVAIGDRGPVPMLASPATQYVDSAFRHSDEVCTISVPVPLRRTAPGNAPWLVGLAAAEPVSPAAWQRSNGKVPETLEGEVKRLVAEAGEGNADANADPFRVSTFLRAVTDGAEVLVIDARRGVSIVVHGDRGTSGTHEIVEQRFVIAERAAGDARAPFRSVYSTIGSDGSDWQSIATPVLMLRMGAVRLLALYADTQSSYGGGGAFIVRMAPGRWSEVAGWSAGC